MSKIKKFTDKCVRQRVRYLSEGPATREWLEVGLESASIRISCEGSAGVNQKVQFVCLQPNHNGRQRSEVWVLFVFAGQILTT